LLHGQEVVPSHLDETGKTVKQAESVYDLSGPGGDGIRVDMRGNVYLAMNFQGRILVFDKDRQADSHRTDAGP